MTWNEKQIVESLKAELRTEQFLSDELLKLNKEMQHLVSALYTKFNLWGNKDEIDKIVGEYDQGRKD